MEVVDACLLLDFYGLLLTDRTRSILELHYSEDMSLAEIAEQESISRQAVHDTIRRGLKSLLEYEDKLQLIRRFQDQKREISEAAQALAREDFTRAKELLSKLDNSL
jgi:predicted DNA-binding protein YlxM (UPF0122 family)